MKAIITLLVGALVLTATAEEKKGGKPQDGRPQRKGPPAEVVAKFDKNKDGKLDEAERKALRDALVKKFDKNKDGKLDEAERKAMFAERAKANKGKGPKGQKGPKGEGKKK